jgi:hypothetical protein
MQVFLYFYQQTFPLHFLQISLKQSPQTSSCSSWKLIKKLLLNKELQTIWSGLYLWTITGFLSVNYITWCNQVILINNLENGSRRCVCYVITRMLGEHERSGQACFYFFYNISRRYYIVKNFTQKIDIEIILTLFSVTWRALAFTVAWLFYRAKEQKQYNIFITFRR